MLCRSLAVSSLAVVSIASFLGCAAENDSNANRDGAQREEALAERDSRDPSVVGSYVSTVSDVGASREALRELTLGDDGRFDAIFLTAADGQGQPFHDEGRYTTRTSLPDGPRFLILQSDAGTVRSFGMTRTSSELSLQKEGWSTRLHVAQWGARGLSLRLTSSGGTLRFDCAAGSFSGPLVLDRTGHFQVAGEFRPGFGVEPPPDTERPVHLVTYEGTIAESTMNVQFALSGEEPRSYELAAGSDGLLMHCL